MTNIYLAKYRMLETMSLYPKFGDWLLSISYFRTLNTKLILYKCDFPTVTRKKSVTTCDLSVFCACRLTASTKQMNGKTTVEGLFNVICGSIDQSHSTSRTSCRL